MLTQVRECAALALFAAGCVTTPGYRVTVEAVNLAQIEPQLVSRLQGTARASGFRAVYEGMEQKQTSVSPERVASIYEKTLSQKRGDYIDIQVYIFEQEKRVVVEVACLLRGQEEPVKTEIDRLGDLFVEELARSEGKDKVFVKREPAHFPFVF